MWILNFQRNLVSNQVLMRIAGSGIAEVSVRARTHYTPTMRVLAFENPCAGRSRSAVLARAYAVLSDAGWRIEVRRPASREAAEEASENLPDCDVVLISGGDGSLSTLVQRYPWDGPPIALLPCGTANVVARDLGLPLDPVSAARALTQSKIQNIDIGEIAWPDGRRRRFVLSAGSGGVAAAVTDVGDKAKKILGRAAYVLSGAKAIGNSVVRCDVDGARLLAGSVIVKVTRYYAGGLVLDADSHPGDARLDVCVVPPGWAAATRFAWQVSQGRSPVMHPARVEFLSESAVESDGDSVGMGPCVCTLAGQLSTITISKAPDLESQMTPLHR